MAPLAANHAVFRPETWTSDAMGVYRCPVDAVEPDEEAVLKCCSPDSKRTSVRNGRSGVSIGFGGYRWSVMTDYLLKMGTDQYGSCHD